MTDVRMVALDILLEYSGSKAFLSEIIKAALDKYSYLEERDRAYIKNAVTAADGETILTLHDYEKEWRKKVFD